MRNLASFLINLQTFKLRIITKAELKSPIKEDGQKQAYSLTHQTQYYDSFSYKSEIRVLKDMALVDLLSLNDISLKRGLDQLKKLKNRFKLLWSNFQKSYRELQTEYPRNYIFSIGLDHLFIVKNLQPDHSDIFIGDEFVESLNDSVKIREKFLTELINEIEEILYPHETFEEFSARMKNQEPSKNASENISDKIPYNEDAGMPKFSEQFTSDFLQVMKSYFSETHHIQLTTLINTNTQPENQLIFRGNGNQLADAFKQLYEANLIAGCKKSDLEKWIAKHFLYATGDVPKEYTEGWLSSIISTDTKFCKSPIIEVRIKDKMPTIVPTVRNKKNSKY
ncbi:hypothetical protein [Pedobacter foliorum]|uniref:hypothetical protein n=1 Tax=Pedobacter foliorum TaxID=2739058 RepID=UPI0015630158|nr:hypothetical protein [Pedobacter foliorum]NRF40224.1 hypothetical protein [Pedobacter foliorum]